MGEGDGFVVRSVADISDIFCSEFEELGWFSFVALQKLSFSFWVLGNIENCAEYFSIGFFVFDWVEIFFKDHFFSILMFAMQIDISELCFFSEKLSDCSDDFGLFQMKVQDDGE